MKEVLIWHEHYADLVYDASTPELLHEAALKILQERLDNDYLFYPDDAEGKAKEILDQKNGAAAYEFLRGRNDHEYERISINPVN